MLRLASTFSDTQSDHLLAAIAGIVFLGAPLRGTSYGNISAAIKSMASATTGISEDDAVLAELLGGDEHLHDNDSLVRLGCEAFEKVWMDFNFRVKTFSETMMQNPRRSWAEWGVVSIPPSFVLRALHLPLFTPPLLFLPPFLLHAPCFFHSTKCKGLGVKRCDGLQRSGLADNSC